jgi:hypothetical protein
MTPDALRSETCPNTHRAHVDGRYRWSSLVPCDHKDFEVLVEKEAK